MAFFKYLKKVYAEDLVRYGRLRIGTIYEYRNYEDAERRDETEGTKLARLKIDNETFYGNKPDEWPQGLKAIFTAPDESSNASYTFKNATFINPFNYPDAFIYCVTTNFDRRVMIDFKCDSCVYIKNIQAFCDIISKKMVELKLAAPSTPSNIQMHFKDCVYSGKESDENIYDTYWLKESRYRHQSESRFVMAASQPNVTLAPIVIRCKNLTKYCEMVNLNKL
jgi:hypothetical protein